MSSVIVQRAEGKAFDEKYLDIAMGERDEYMGYAFVDEGEIKYGEMPLENKTEAKEEIATTENYPLILTFAKDVPTDESKQPFVTLSKDDGTPAVVTFIEGDTKATQFENQSHSKEFCYHQEILAPKLIEMLGLFNDDLGKLYEYLNKPSTKLEMVSTAFPGGSDTRGEILILFTDGKTINMSKGDRHKKYEWGETSFAFGYEAKPVEAPKKITGLGAHSKTNKTSVPMSGSGKANSIADPDKDKKPNTAIADAMKTAEDRKTNLDYMIVPPPHIFTSIQALEGWYTSFGDPASKPTNEEFVKMKGNAHLAIPIKVKPTLSNSAFNKLLSLNKFLLAPAGGKPAEKKDTETKLTVPIIIIPKNELERVQKVGDKVMKAKEDDGSGLIYKPDTILKYAKENKHISATDQVGYQMGLDEFEGYYEIWDEYIPNHTFIKALLVQYMLERHKDKQALQQVLKNQKAM